MIRFSASLVVVAFGLLIAGAVTSQLALVYLAIAVSVVALTALVTGVALKRGELFGQPPQSAPGGVTEPGFAPSRQAVPVAAGTAAAGPARGPDRERAERAGYGQAPGDDPPYRDDAEPRHRDNAAHHDRPAYRDDAGYDRAAPDRAGYRETGGHVHEFYYSEYSERGGFAGQGDRAEQGDFAGQGNRGAYGWQDDPGRGAGRGRDDRQRERGDRQREYETRPVEGRLGERWTIAETPPGQEPAQEAEIRPGQGSGTRPGQEPDTAGGADELAGTHGAGGRGGPAAPAVAGDPGEDVSAGVQAREAGATELRTAGPGEARPGDAQAGEEAAGVAAASRESAKESPAATRSTGEPVQTEPVQTEETAGAQESLPEEHSGPAEDTAGRGPDSPGSAEGPAASAGAAAEAVGAGPGESAGPAESAGPGESTASAESAGPGESTASAESAGPGESAGPAESTASAEQTVTVVPGVPRYHRAGCILIRFMGEDDLERTPLEAAKEAGCTPCRACQPDGKAAV